MNKIIKQIIESKFNFNIDIEGNEQQDLLSKSIYKSTTQKVLYDAYADTIDLGLPSGTRWCKDNLDVKPNVVLNVPGSISGKFYAWGELLSRRSTYSWLNYKFAVAKINAITKYCTEKALVHPYGSEPDGMTRLLPEDDVATVKLGQHYHIPTKEQFKELLENTTVHHKHDYLVDGLNGVLYVSKINGNKIFLPYAGYDNSMNKIEKEEGTKRLGQVGLYWTSDLYEKDSRCAYIYLSTSNDITYMERRIGASIRPVFNF